MDAAYCTTIGADVSDRTTKICVMSKADGKPKIVQETTIPTTPDGFRAFLERQDKAAALVFETGTHWAHTAAGSTRSLPAWASRHSSRTRAACG